MMGARTPADPQTSTFARKKCSGLVVKSSKRPFFFYKTARSNHQLREKPLILPVCHWEDSVSQMWTQTCRLDQTSCSRPLREKLQFVQLLLCFGRAVEAIIWGPATCSPVILWWIFLEMWKDWDQNHLGPEPSGLFRTSDGAPSWCLTSGSSLLL